MAARIGNIASCGIIFAEAASEATEIAAECVSTNPATTAPIATPVSPSQSLKIAATTSMAAIIAASPRAVATLKARPGSAVALASAATPRNAKAIP